MQLMLMDFTNGVVGKAKIAKVEVGSVLVFACRTASTVLVQHAATRTLARDYHDPANQTATRAPVLNDPAASLSSRGVGMNELREGRSSRTPAKIKPEQNT